MLLQRSESNQLSHLLLWLTRGSLDHLHALIEWEVKEAIETLVGRDLGVGRDLRERALQGAIMGSVHCIVLEL